MPMIKSPKERLEFTRQLSALDLDKRRAMARRTMTKHFVILQEHGATKGAKGPEEFYGFKVEDVQEMYFYKHGTGPGTWYRLNDSRVIDIFGEPDTSEAHWYTSGPN